jgi:hypothetical protein
MPPSLLSDAALVTRGRPVPSRAWDLRTDAILLTRGREGSESLLAASSPVATSPASRPCSPTSAPASSPPPRAPR